MQTGVNLIAGERLRQIEDKHYSSEHDDKHVGEELAMAAAFYAIPEKFGELLVFWPWDDSHKKRDKTRIRQLVVAGALIAAEIDRLLRADGNSDGI